MGKIEKEKKTEEWEKTTNRFVAFFDIMGFKELVARNTHTTILDKLERLSEILTDLKNHNNSPGLGELLESKIGETRTITFSDSIVFFSKGDTVEDANKIITDAYSIIRKSLENRIPIKGALSFGEITVDFENSLFFGQPIIDAFLIHDELQLYTAVLDNHFEKKLDSINLSSKMLTLLHDYKTPFKRGKISHKVVCPVKNKKTIQKFSNWIYQMRQEVAGNPRIYVDNTLDFYDSLLAK